MLTTKLLTLAQPIYLPQPEIPQGSLPLLPPPAKRKRGAQPGNQNARRDKAREASLLIPSALSGTTTTLAPEAIANGVANPAARAAGLTFIDLDRRFRHENRAGLAEDIKEFTEYSQILSDHFDQAIYTGQHKATNLAFKCLITCASAIGKFAELSIRLTLQERALASCADHAYLARIRKNPDVCVYKPSFLQKPDTLSTYAGADECPVSFLNDRQWFLLEPLIKAQVAADQAVALASRDPAKKQRASRAVPWPERFLLDGILWKLATACTWPKLPKPYPVRRCQALYQSLQKSGRLGHIFTILHEDFNACCRLSLKQMALNGEYLLWGSKILYIPHGKHNWQGLITLLLLQGTRRVLLREQRNRPPSLGYKLAHCYPDLPSLYSSTSDMELLKKLINPRKLVPRGILRIPPPYNHPSLKNLPLQFSRIWGGLGVGSPPSSVEAHLSVCSPLSNCHPPVRASAKSPARRGKGERSEEVQRSVGGKVPPGLCGSKATLAPACTRRGGSPRVEK